MRDVSKAAEGKPTLFETRSALLRDAGFSSMFEMEMESRLPGRGTGIRRQIVEIDVIDEKMKQYGRPQGSEIFR